MNITIVDLYGKTMKGLGKSLRGRRIFINGKKLPKNAGSCYPHHWSESFTVSVAINHFKKGAYLK
jgi:hypothetical protein